MTDKNLHHKEETEADKHYRNKQKIISAISLVALIAIGIGIMIAFEPIMNIIKEPEEFRQWLSGQGALGYLVFLGICCLQVVVAIIPGEAIEIGAGYAFGAAPGLILCLLGTMIGSSLIYGFTKLLGVRMVEAFISREKINQLQFINNSRKRNMLVFLLFFIPGTPKDMLTYFIGLTPMKLHQFLLISTIARIPSVVSSTIGGDLLGTQNYHMAVVVFLITGVVSAIGLYVYNRIQKKKEQEEKAREQQ